jgi:uncharacterized protein with NRDE domain
MCLIVLAWKAHPRYPLILATNRDELHARRSAALGYWEGMTNVIGGRDIEKGGSWLAANIDGRWAAVTNFRDGSPASAPSLSRGDLVKNYVLSDQTAKAYAANVDESLSEYPGCNLLIGEADELYYASNRNESEPRSGIRTVSPGIHGLSNHLLNTPWPKVERCKQHMGTLLNSDADAITRSLFELLADRAIARDTDLPSTGVPLDRERVLSAPFIVAENYGTRASTVLLMDDQGTVQMHERGFGAGGSQIGQRSFSFNTSGHKK